jgi:hypothetical protein
MGMGIRVFFIDNNDALIKVSYARWDRLHSDHPTECFPEYAGKKIRYIFVILDLEERKPVFINRIDCGYVTFDAAGKLDREEWAKHLLLAVESADLLGPEKTDDNVIMARAEFLRRRYHHRYRWDFPHGMLDRLIKTIFG